MRKKFHNSYLAHFLLFNFFFLAYSLFSTLISVYMQDLGYSNAQVSMVVSASFFASMLAQFSAMLWGLKRSSFLAF